MKKKAILEFFNKLDFNQNLLYGEKYLIPLTLEVLAFINIEENVAYISSIKINESFEISYRDFKKAELFATSVNCIYFNPKDWIDENCDVKLAMKFCLAILPFFETIIMQAHWKKCKHACLEHKIAKKLGLNILYMKGL